MDLEKGLSEYEDPNKQIDAINSLNSVLDKIKLLPQDLISSDEVKDILKKSYEYIGLAHFNRGELDKAERNFTLLIMLDPTSSLDESFLSPKIIKYFNYKGSQQKI